MGIPRFFYWLYKEYPYVITKIQERETLLKHKINIDTYALDLNAIVHPICQQVFGYGQYKDGQTNGNIKRLMHVKKVEYPSKRIECYNKICEKIEEMVNIVNPKSKLILALDGTAGMSKQYQQRQRRYRAVLDNPGNEKKEFDIVIQKKTKIKIKFKDHELPEGELIDENNPLHKVYVDYVQSRGINYNEYPFLITPTAKGRYANRIIIPYTYKNKIVGHTSRFLDNKIPKYINEQQPGYVFNIDIQKPEWQVCILTEGIFDALSIDGIAIMHDDISNEQAQLISSLNKQIIVVPDRDKTGLKICDRALELGYSVSLPNWESDIKDVNDAVVRYGKLPTLLSILQSATMSKIKIEIQRKKIEKTIR